MYAILDTVNQTAKFTHTLEEAKHCVATAAGQPPAVLSDIGGGLRASNGLGGIIDSLLFNRFKIVDAAKVLEDIVSTGITAGKKLYDIFSGGGQ